MSFLKVNGVIQLLGKKTAKMLYSSSSKTNDTSSDGCNTTKETNDDLKDSSSPLDTLTYSLSTFYNVSHNYYFPFGYLCRLAEDSDLFFIFDSVS